MSDAPRPTHWPPARSGFIPEIDPTAVAALEAFLRAQAPDQDVGDAMAAALVELTTLALTDTKAARAEDRWLVAAELRQAERAVAALKSYTASQVRGPHLRLRAVLGRTDVPDSITGEMISALTARMVALRSALPQLASPGEGGVLRPYVAAMALIWFRLVGKQPAYHRRNGPVAGPFSQFCRLGLACLPKPRPDGALDTAVRAVCEELSRKAAG